MRKTSSTSLGAAAIALTAGWVVAAPYTFDGSRAENALDLPGSDALAIRQLAPQGWAFFTRSPRERDFDVLRYDPEHGSQTLLRYPNFSAPLFLGWRRANRAQGLEFGLMTNELEARELSSCKGPVEDCAETLAAQPPIANTAPNPTLCGDVLVVYREPVPWAWAKSADDIEMPSEIMKVRLEC